MSRNGLLIDYEYCTGCHSCEVACRQELGIPNGKWGIKLAEIGPWQVSPEKWEYNYIPVPTELCNLCSDRTAKGKKPACVHHCQAGVMQYGPIEEMAAKVNKNKIVMFVP